MTNQKRKLIIIRGPLGVGKSTISKLLAKKINAEYLSLDKILKDNNLEGTNGIPLKNFLKSNAIIFKLITDSEESFIIDGCFYYQEQIDNLQEKFENKIIIFTLISNVEKCIERDSRREKVYGEGSTRFVHIITTKIKAGHEIDNSNLTIEETIDKIVENI